MNDRVEIVYFHNNQWIAIRGGDEWEETLASMLAGSRFSSALYEVSFKSEIDGKIELIDTLYIHNGQAYQPVDTNAFLENLRGTKAHLS